MIVKQVPEMEVLGSLIDFKSNTNAALAHRLAKASNAEKKFDHLLFTRHNPLKEKFLECFTAVAAGAGAMRFTWNFILGKEWSLPKS